MKYALEDKGVGHLNPKMFQSAISIAEWMVVDVCWT